MLVVVCVALACALVAVALERRAAVRALQRLARTDGLTGLANYRTFVETLEDEVARAARHHDVFSLLWLDLDRLKDLNDALGHAAGNGALVRVARAMRAGSRSIDTPARVGGDEFALILPETPRLEAATVAARISRHLGAARAWPPVDVSWGVATYPVDGASADELIEFADRQMYLDKHDKARRRVPHRAPRASRVRHRGATNPTGGLSA